MNPLPRFLSTVCAALACGALAAPAAAATFTVGDDPTHCTHASLQAALNAAHANPGPDVVHIVRTVNWTAQQISIQTDGDVEIVGGFTACSSQQPSGRTTLDGQGGAARSVIALRGNAVFRLRNLLITGGDQAGDDDGGGIHFEGGGIVHIVDSTISENSADEGGGIYAHGTTITAEVILEDTLVTANTARRHGGGAVAQELEMTIRGSGSSLLANTAGGSGGGLLVRSGGRKSYAYVSGGLFGVQGNRAARGGGIAVQVGPEYEDAELQVFSTDAAVPVLIAGNTATERGGGIDVQPYYESGLSGFPGSETTGRVQLRNVDLRDNTAPVGAAVNLAHVNYGPFGAAAMGAQLAFNVDVVHPLHPDAAPCPVGKPCGYLRQNDTGNTTGAVVHLSNDARFFGSRIAVQDNAGGWLMYIAGEDPVRLELADSLVTGNRMAHALIRDDQNADSSVIRIALDHLTLAGNTVGANGLFSFNEDVSITRSLVDQAGSPLFATDVGTTGGTRDLHYVFVKQSGDAPGTTVVPAFRFVDPARGDYSLRAGAQAVDHAPPLEPAGLDLHSRPRVVDLAGKQNFAGSVDVGALERPALQPLVLNENFDADLNLWSTGAGVVRDAAQNIAGPAGSGSARVPMPSVASDGGQGRIAADLAQCIHLPGPGTYELNGFARVLPSSNPPLAASRAALAWRVNYDGSSEGCGVGAPDQSGIHPLATTSTWTRPASPAYINIPTTRWTRNTSITLVADVAGAPSSNTVAWYDGIRLELGTGLPPESGLPFRNGFED